MTDSTPLSGVTRDDLDDAVGPRDDLFLHVNHRWNETHAIPDDKSRYGTFDVLFDEAEAAVRVIIEDARSAAEGSEARKIGDLYASFLDEATVNARGLDPVRELLASVADVTGVEDLVGTIGSWQRQGLGGLYGVFVDSDPGDPERYVVLFEQDGLSLPDESYYREEHFAEVRDAYVAHVAAMFTLAGFDDAATRARRVMDLEIAIAGHHWNNVETRDAEKTYNLMTWESARDLFAGANFAGVSLDVWREGLGVSATSVAEVVLRQPSFTGALASLLTETDLEAWRDWLRWQVLHGYAPYLSADVVEENFDFYGRTLTGAQTLRERWKRGVRLVEDCLGEAVGKIYVERHFPADVKSRMDALVANLLDAYRQSITSLAWMSEPTRQRALEKLDAFTPKIGYPVRWRDYGALEISPTDLIANVRATNEFEFQRQLAKIGAPIDRDEWFMTPQTINAYYNPGFNEVVFPASILQPPFFDVARDEAANYGAIGAIIGHEIGHGFDDQGSKFDGSGKLADWWTDADRAAFDEKANALIVQYDALSPRETPSLHVNGALTVGENIGDLGGLGIAWKAYQLSLRGAPAPVVDGFSAAERFFFAWSLSWREKAQVAEVERLLAIDPHSPPEFRCNQIARNLDVFHETFDVRPGDAMWLEPADRVEIW